MIEDRTRILATTLHKLYARGARHNIQRVLVKTHTADIAETLSQLTLEERLEIFRYEPSLEKRAEILSHFNEEIQRELLTSLTKDEVLKLVALMDRDDAADLLGHLPEEESQEILSAMVREDSEEVAGLMGYPEDTAGGLMSSDFLSFNHELTVQKAIERIQSEEDKGAVTFYLYVVNDNEQLVGVVSLKHLLLSRQRDRLKEIMYPNVISVTVDTTQDEVAKTVERYDFLAIPVVDANNKLVGVITVDDVIDVIREEAEEDLLAMGQAGWEITAPLLQHLKARLPWLFLTFLGGGLCFAIVYFFGVTKTGPEMTAFWIVTAFIPLILSMGGTTGNQAATVAVGGIRSSTLESGQVFKHLKKELKLSVLFAFVFGLLVLGLGEWLFPAHHLSLALATAMTLQILIAMSLGSAFPFLVNKVSMDPTVVSVPLFAAIADVLGVAVLFGLFHVW